MGSQFPGAKQWALEAEAQAPWEGHGKTFNQDPKQKCFNPSCPGVKTNLRIPTFHLGKGFQEGEMEQEENYTTMLTRKRVSFYSNIKRNETGQRSQKGRYI